MGVKLSSLKADLKKEQDGDWIEIPDLPGVSLKVRSFNFVGYRVARDTLFQKLGRKHGRKNPLPPEVVEVELGALYAEHILLDWTGFDVPHDAATAREALTDPGYRDLRRHVEWAAGQVGETEVEFVEDAEKN